MDLTIAIVQNPCSHRLANINSVFRTIDLTCYVLAPLLAGFLFDYINSASTAVFIVLWNLVSGIILI